MEPKGTSRIGFCLWLEQTVNEGSCPGLEWVNKDQGLFKVPWYHFNKCENLRTHFKVYRDWAVYTGIHVPGDEEDFPKWKRNFRCALNKVSDISEVRELHSDKSSKAPFKVYRFLKRHSPTPATQQEEGWILVDASDELVGTSMMSFEPIATSSLYPSTVVSPLGNDSENTPVSFTTYTAETLAAPELLSQAHNIPTVVADALSYCENSEQTSTTQDQNLMEDEHQEPHRLEPHQYFTDEQQQRVHDKRKPQHIGRVSALKRPFDDSGAGSSNRDPWISLQDEEHMSERCETDLPDGTPMSISENLVTADFKKEQAHPVKEVELTGLAEREEIQESDEKMSIPSDLVSVSSDDLFCVPGSGPPYPSSLALDNDARKGGKVSYLQTAVPHTVKPEEEGITVKVFYGFHLQKVLERTIVDAAKGCSVYFGQQKRDIPDFAERIYGPRDTVQLELPRADIIGNSGSGSGRMTEYMDAILREMQRGVVLTARDGDLYAKRFCRTRAFVYDQDKHSWPLTRKINIPEKIFDFDTFRAKFDKYKQSVLEGDQKSIPPLPHVYLTFGHRVPLENEIHGKVLVAMLVTHRRAEQMLRGFQSMLGIDNPAMSANRFLSSMDTMDKLVDNYDSMSIE
ncbi:hypothetical protein EGW08_010362 [Elysia chlorotica]|uniref:IRF tryptophan pentad repeat domain-containing protein n=1 Tax=Elysia chlorotica TaxID=188477 RepID=A0A433TJZ5_ELYCH|nr:hypothetical protein EGW08_010362 [Elysia chlorotica]